jgi:hypothetical protein
MSVMDRLFGGYWRPEPRHEHQWETIKVVEIEVMALGERVDTRWVYHLRCKTCGEIGRREVKS